MSVITREFWVQRYAYAGVAYLVVVSALQWSRGGPSGAGLLSDLVASYAWHTIGFLLLAFGWWRAARRDR